MKKEDLIGTITYLYILPSLLLFLLLLISSAYAKSRYYEERVNFKTLIMSFIPVYNLIIIILVMKHLIEDSVSNRYHYKKIKLLWKRNLN